MSDDHLKLLHSYSQRSRLLPNAIAYDIAFVLNVNSKGWILDKICQVIAKYSGLHCTIIYSERNNRITLPLPPARAYFFGHYAIAFFAMTHNPAVMTARNYIWFTHPDPEKGVNFDGLVNLVKCSDATFVANSRHRDMLSQLGAPQEKIEMVLGGADPETFVPTPRGSGKVAFVSAYYPRKRPELVIDTIRNNPHIEFMILGPHPDELTNQNLLWSAWERFDELKDLPNLEYIEAFYDDFPAHFQNIDVLISLSELEGGPIPLIEALMANCLIISTDTGFARDLIKPHENGFLLSNPPAQEDINAAIAWAVSHTEPDVSAWAREHLSWRQFGEQIAARMFPDFTGGRLTFSDTGLGESIAQGGWGLPDRTGMVAERKRAYLMLKASKVSEFTAYRMRLWRSDGREEQTPIAVGFPSNEVRRYRLSSGDPHLVNFISRSHALERTMLVESSYLTKETGRGLKLGEIECVPLSGLRAGMEVQFGRNHEYTATLESGWHYPDTSGTWSSHPHARMVMPLSESLRNGNFQLRIKGRALGGRPGAPAGVECSIPEDSVTIEYLAEESETVEIVLHVPARRTASDFLVLFITSRQFITPAAVNSNSSDTRSLGFQLQEVMAGHLQLVEAAPASASKAPETAQTGGTWASGTSNGRTGNSLAPDSAPPVVGQDYTNP